MNCTKSTTNVQHKKYKYRNGSFPIFFIKSGYN